MDFFDAAARRYSHKGKFLPDPVPLADLERIAAAGLAAPSGANQQSVRLVLLPDEAALAPLRAVAKHGGLDSAPAAIVLLTDGSTQKLSVNFEMEDYAAAAQTMLLAATALGYASLWLDSPFFDEGRQAAALAALGAPAGTRIRVVLPIGKPDGEGSRREKLPFEQRAFYGRYGAGK